MFLKNYSISAIVILAAASFQPTLSFANDWMTKDYSEYPESKEEVIAKYFKLKSGCSEAPELEFLRDAPASFYGDRSYINHDLAPTVLESDFEVEVKVNVCGIKAHNVVWVRDKGHYFLIEAVVPFSSLTK